MTTLDELRIKVEKLSPKPSDLLVFTGPPGNDELHKAAAQLLLMLPPGVGAVIMPERYRIDLLTPEQFAENIVEIVPDGGSIESMLGILSKRFCTTCGKDCAGDRRCWYCYDSPLE